jgi:hypothetical protein
MANPDQLERKWHTNSSNSLRQVTYAFEANQCEIKDKNK